MTNTTNPDRAHTLTHTQSDRAHTVDNHAQPHTQSDRAHTLPLTVHYWMDGYWTLDDDEADLADRFNIYAGSSQVLVMPDGSTQYEIEEGVRNALNRAHTVAHTQQTVRTR